MITVFILLWALRKEEEISRAKISCRILAKNKANFEFNAARCTKNLTQFLGKRQAKLALLITDAFLSIFCRKIRVIFR
jgi:hypothetical protein